MKPRRSRETAKERGGKIEFQKNWRKHVCSQDRVEKKCVCPSSNITVSEGSNSLVLKFQRTSESPGELVKTQVAGTVSRVRTELRAKSLPF